MTKPNWPTKYTIKKRRWTISYVPKTSKYLLDDEDGGDYNLGICRSDQRKIWICTDQSESSIRDTLWHELVHACYATAAMAGTSEDPEDREENVVLFATEAAFEIISGADWAWYVGD